MSKSKDGRSCEIELDGRNLNYWSSGNRHKEGRSFAYGSITEQEKLSSSAKMPQPRRARQKVAILLVSGGSVRSSDDVSGNQDVAKGLN